MKLLNPDDFQRDADSPRKRRLSSVGGEREDRDNASAVGRSREQSVRRATARLAVALLAGRWKVLQNIPGKCQFSLVASFHFNSFEYFKKIRCLRHFSQIGAPCPETMELAPAAGDGTTAECRCPPGTAQSPRDALCHPIFTRASCTKGQFFAPVPVAPGKSR